MPSKKMPKAAADSPSLACADASQEAGEVRNLEDRILKWRDGEVLSRAGKRREREEKRARDGRTCQLEEQAMQVPRGQGGVTRGQSCGPRRRVRETPDAMSALESTPGLAGLSGGLMGPCRGGNF